MVGGFTNWCLDCTRAWHRDHDKKPEVKKRRMELRANRRSENPEKYRLRDREFYAEKKDIIAQYPSRQGEGFKNRQTIQNLKRYKLSKADYEKMVINQDGRCACCGKKRKLFVDHDHATGKVRALLCHHCNCAIGFVYENLKIAEAVVRYIRNMKRSHPQQFQFFELKICA